VVVLGMDFVIYLFIFWYLGLDFVIFFGSGAGEGNLALGTCATTGQHSL
jgi:hypothetical protein